LLRKEAIWIEIFENDRGDGRFGHGVGTWGLCATQGGGGATTTKKELRKIASGAQQFVVGHLAQKARSFFRPGLFSIGTNDFCFY
jgi:hypothetical protein